MSERIIAPDAIRDLREIADYYAIHNVEAGERILKEFNKKCAYLVQFPMMGRSYEAVRPGLRAVPMGDYLLFYRILEPGLEVVRVMRGDRDWRSWLEVD
jgi:toxin ParE1/3/4